jgi:hypothetical protein
MIASPHFAQMRLVRWLTSSRFASEARAVFESSPFLGIRLRPLSPIFCLSRLLLFLRNLVRRTNKPNLLGDANCVVCSHQLRIHYITTGWVTSNRFARMRCCKHHCGKKPTSNAAHITPTLKSMDAPQMSPCAEYSGKSSLHLLVAARWMGRLNRYMHSLPPLPGR